MQLNRIMAGVRALVMAPDGEAAGGGAAAGAAGAGAAGTGAVGAGDGKGAATAATGDGKGAAAAGDGKAAGDGAGTLGAGGGAGDGKGAPATWPENWRTELSADPKAAKTLERFASPKDVYNAYEALRQKMSSGELKPVTAFPEKGTDAEKTQWRKDQGIPDKVEGYGVAMDKLDERTKPLVESYLKAALEANIPPGAAQASVATFLKMREDAAAAQKQADGEYRMTSEDDLRAEWGEEFRPNVNRVKNLLATGPKGLTENFLGARLADGSLLGDNPDVMKFLAGVSRSLNPTDVIPGPDGGSIIQSVETEIAAIEKTMKTDRAAYNADKGMQARLLELYRHREKLKPNEKK